MVVSYARTVLATLLVSLVTGAAFAAGCYYLGRVVAQASAPPGASVQMVDLPGPFGGWLDLWLPLSAVIAVVSVPRDLLRKRRIITRSRKARTFVLWRLAGHWELRGPDGTVVPVDGFGMLGWVRPGDELKAQGRATDAVAELTGQTVVLWEPDSTGRPLTGDSSWIARLLT